MMINTMMRLLGTTVGPLWAAAGEGGSGAADGATADTTDTTGTTAGAGKTTEAGATAPSGEVVLGSEPPGQKPEDGADAGGDAKEDGAEKSDEDKAKDAANAVLDAVPEDGKYTFELPEGITLPEDKQEFWAKEFKDAGMTQRQASRMIDLQAKLVLGERDAQNQQLIAQQVDHLKAAKADKDIGGARWGETAKLANVGLKALGGEHIKNLILATGNGNNPEMLRELRRIGERFASDKFESGPTTQAPVPAESKWYGETTPDSKKG